MKKVLFILPLLCLALTGCDIKNNARNYYRVQIVEQKGAVFCDNTCACADCLEYAKLKDYLDEYNVVALTCTDVGEHNGVGNHIHYCLVYSE